MPRKTDNKTDDFIISVKGLKNAFGDSVVHEGLDLDVRRGEILGVSAGRVPASRC